jgi:hypothetical protein
VKHTYNEIVRVLKGRGWKVKRYRWYAPKKFSKHFQTLGIDLRAAASLEQLEASESLDTRRRKRRKPEQPQNAGIGMYGIQMGN